MEIHEYMSAKSVFMMKMLRLSGQLTNAEIEDIRRATSAAVRMAPIKLGHLVMREFVIGDVDALLRAGLAPTIQDAEELAVSIIRDAGMVKRKHAELAILERGDREGGQDVQMVGRLGVRIVEDGGTIAADKSLRRVLDAIPTELGPVGRMIMLYVFVDPRRDDATMVRKALDAFVLALEQTLQKNGSDDETATDTDSETVWHLLRGSKLLRIDNGDVKGGLIFQVNSST
jgi:hypothetical protein